MSSPAPLADPARDRRLSFLWSGLIALAAVLIYSRCLGYGLVPIDDPGYVGDNPFVMNGLSWKGTRWAFLEFHRSNWHPLTWLSLQLDASLFGRNFGGFHLTNILLHAANSVLVLWVFFRLTGELARSAAVAALFAVHPQHVESVAWVTERKDVLSLLFGLMTMLVYVAYVRRRSATRYAAVLILFLLSLLSKPMLVTLPFVLLLLDAWPLGRFGVESGWRLLLEKLPLIALSGASSLLTMLAQRSGLAVKPESLYPLGERLGNATLSLLWYVEQTFWPFNLTALYPHTHARLSELRVLAASGLLVAFTAGAFVLRRRCPAILIGWLWFVGALFPVLGVVVQQGWQGMADRYVYWPHVGLLLAIVWGVADIAKRWQIPSRLLPMVTAVLCIACAVLSIRQCGTWQDGRTLSLQALAARSPNPAGHVGLGITLVGEGDLNAAAREFQAAVTLDPDFPPALNRLAGALCELGRPEEAMRHYERLGHLLPKGIGWRLDFGRACLQSGQFPKAIDCYRGLLEQKPDLAAAQLGLGNSLHLAGRFDEARPALIRAVEMSPDSAEAHYWLGRNALWMHNESESLTSLREACRLQPGFVPAVDLLAQLLLMQGQPQQAATVMNEALGRQPDSVVLLSTAALIQNSLGQNDEAARLYRQATQRDPRWPNPVHRQAWRWATHPDSHQRFPKLAILSARKLTEAFPRQYLGFDALAAAQASAGEFESAVTSARIALDLCRDNPEATRAIQERLSLYERKQAFVEPR